MVAFPTSTSLQRFTTISRPAFAQSPATLRAGINPRRHLGSIPAHRSNSPCATSMHLSYHASNAGDPCSSAADTAGQAHRTLPSCLYLCHIAIRCQRLGLESLNDLSSIGLTVGRQAGTAGDASRIASSKLPLEHGSTVVVHAAGCSCGRASTLLPANEV